MKRSLSCVFSAIFGTVICLHAIPALAQVRNRVDVKEIDKLKIRKTDDKPLPFKFNYDRPFVISINRGIPDAPAIREELIKLLADNRMLNAIVFDWFGSVKPETIEVKIGKRVPIEIAQAVMRVLPRQDNTFIVVSIYNDDDRIVDNQRISFGYTQRVFIGALVESRLKPISKETMDALLKEGITQKEFLSFLSEAR